MNHIKGEVFSVRWETSHLQLPTPLCENKNHTAYEQKRKLCKEGDCLAANVLEE